VDTLAARQDLVTHPRKQAHLVVCAALAGNVFVLVAQVPVNRLPSSPEQAHVVHEVRRIQGYLGGSLPQFVRALRDDEAQRTSDSPG
jgi:hypothetical protein